LILRPSLLLLDNPLAGLDFTHEQWWLKFLDALAGTPQEDDFPPMTIIATTDDLRPWAAHARQFAILKERRFIVLGGADRLEAAGPELLRNFSSRPEQTDEHEN
jgi:ABC-type multidrug transport system ATPase subunit